MRRRRPSVAGNAALCVMDHNPNLLVSAPRYSGDAAVDRSVARLNIEHYKRLLARETDEARRQLLLRLLAEEEAKIADSRPQERKRRPR